MSNPFDRSAKVAVVTGEDYGNKVAVITGAGRGIGRGIALRCAKEGMKVVLAGFGMESLTRTAADLEALGAETLIVQTDVSQVEQVENLAAATIEAFGQVESAPHVKVSVLCPGWVATEFYRVDQSRPERFKGETTGVTEKHRENWRGWLAAGITTDQAAQILFDGLAQNKLYIGPQGFREAGQDVGEKVKNRAQNIVQEKNPLISSS